MCILAAGLFSLVSGRGGAGQMDFFPACDLLHPLCDGFLTIGARLKTNESGATA